MKSVESAKTSPEGGWTTSDIDETYPAASTRAMAPTPFGGDDSRRKSLPDNDPTRVFLHQLSQTLTSLRGSLELALLIDSGPDDYRRIIQQSLVQADGMVRLFKSFRAMAQGEGNQPCE